MRSLCSGPHSLTAEDAADGTNEVCQRWTDVCDVSSQTLTMAVITTGCRGHFWFGSQIEANIGQRNTGIMFQVLFLKPFLLNF